MLTKKDLKKISYKHCAEMLGLDFIEKNKEFCCASYGIMHDEKFHYDLCVGFAESEGLLGAETPMDFYASVVVDPDNGNVTRDYTNSKLPI